MAGANGQITADSVAVKMKDESAEITFDDCCALRDEHNSLIGKAKSAKKRLQSEPKTGDNQAALAYSIAKFLEHANGIEYVDLGDPCQRSHRRKLGGLQRRSRKAFPRGRRRKQGPRVGQGDRVGLPEPPSRRQRQGRQGAAEHRHDGEGSRVYGREGQGSFGPDVRAAEESSLKRYLTLGFHV